MKFNSIIIPEKISSIVGLAPITIERLGDVVALVGRNGSGKTRVLNLIEEQLSESFYVNQILDGAIKHLPLEITEILPRITAHADYFKIKKVMEEYQFLLSKKGLGDDNFLEFETIQREFSLLSSSTEVKKLNVELSAIIGRLKKRYVKRIHNSEIRALQQAADSSAEGVFEKLLENVSEKIDVNEFSMIQQGALRYLSKLPHQLSHEYFQCLSEGAVFEDSVSYMRYMSLKKFVHDFLQKELTWIKRGTKAKLTDSGSVVTYTGQWEINNRPFNYLEFSDGEKTLFAYALLFFLMDLNPNLNIKESIILVDEPELHLHPESEIDVINGIRNVISEKGQLIFATHSINILSTLNYDEIFMVKDGVVHRPSNSTPSITLSELMGLDDRVNKLTEFLTSISTWSYVNFMAQCFSNPEVIESARKNDPQVEALKKAINERLTKSNAMLLDFGAGKGRLFEQIKQDYEFISKVNYSALEIEESFHEKLKNLGASQVFSSYHQLMENSFDFFLLCNVLHEIPLDEWQISLNNIIKSLKPDGFLIIIEAKTLSKGEKIGKIGYLLLDVQELQKLFGTSGLPGEIISRDSNAITCAVFSKADLREITKDDIVNCLVALETNTLTKVEELRNTNYDATQLHHAGRSSAFWSILHLNARFAQNHLKSLN